jgi:glucosamine--fructose-6-phosphate aminotransferase (isomerizing)
MCGIVGKISLNPVNNLIIDGLKKLEYRGYDSVGMAIINSNNKLKTLKSAGKIKDFLIKYNSNKIEGNIGIGHTRWATHGIPSDLNAHPILDYNEKIAVVHNGIIENYLDIKNSLIEEGYLFQTDTDTECISNLISFYTRNGNSIMNSIKLTLDKIIGHAAVLVIDEESPDKIFGFKKGFAGSLLIGKKNKEISIASDFDTLKTNSDEYIVLEDYEYFYASKDKIEIFKQNKPRTKTWMKIKGDTEIVSKENYKYFMEKEIHEQSAVFLRNLQGRVDFNEKSIDFTDDFSKLKLEKIERIHLIGMGSSYYACMLGSYWLEKISKIPTQFSTSSEFRYRSPVIENNTLIIPVSQSGETADTLSASNLVKELNISQIAITNSINSELERITNNTIMMRANTEIAVASTKTFMATIEILFMLSIYFAKLKNVNIEKNIIFEELKIIPSYIDNILGNVSEISKLAKKYSINDNFLFLGRGQNLPIAMEGALKLKELSYIHAEGYPAGEMKHGPIALIDENMPVFNIVTEGQYFNKMISNIREIGSRNGKIIVLTNCPDKLDPSWYTDIISFDRTNDLLSPFLSTVCVQLFSMYTAISRKLDIDQPRNLAKSVTVE